MLDEYVNLPITVNGRLKETIKVPLNIKEEEVKKLVSSHSKFIDLWPSCGRKVREVKSFV